MKQIEDLTDEDLMEVWPAIGGAPHLFEYGKDELRKVLIDGSCEDENGDPIGIQLDFYTMTAITDVLRSRGFTTMQFIGLKDAKDKPVFVGDMYFEETEDDNGDTRVFFVITWIKEWAQYVALAIGEIADYEDNGVTNLDEDRPTFRLTADEFSHWHFKGNVITNPELLKLDNTQPETD